MKSREVRLVAGGVVEPGRERGGPSAATDDDERPAGLARRAHERELEEIQRVEPGKKVEGGHGRRSGKWGRKR